MFKRTPNDLAIPSHLYNVIYPDQRDSESLVRAAFAVASLSQDPVTQVGAILVDPNNPDHPIVAGCNHSVIPRPDDEESTWTREDRLRVTIHAEVAAILAGLEAFGNVEGFHLYTTAGLCADCAKYVLYAGITTVVTHRGALNTLFINRPEWKPSVQMAHTLLEEWGVSVVFRTDPTDIPIRIVRSSYTF